MQETFAWMHHYWYLTNNGIEFLRTYLNLPSEIISNTLKRATSPIPTGGRFGGSPPDGTVCYGTCRLSVFGPGHQLLGLGREAGFPHWEILLVGHTTTFVG
ncbi:40S ribosomal protein S10-2 [Camellia lanceoleosa]|uniref:40S ribosomal protein S10-2 n=1 Tax=Camellia lanceoleosa TaxID=1840588 RepID=A0ACC0GU30_9ERIC|nr:40S ribosomal protein S10-2 [Camellia lanceoleosa]